MRDALGGAVVMQIIIIFLLIINSYLAFSVNYTKAFRVKNRIISIIENYEGLTEGEKGSQTAINNMMKENSYSIDRNYIDKCGGSSGLENYYPIYNDMGGYCVYITPTSVTGQNLSTEKYKGAVYSVTVFINIDLPVLNKIFPYFANVFAIKGETKTIYSSGYNTELER